MEFLDEKQGLVKLHEQQVDSLKAKIKSEREKATEEERDFIRSRYQKQYEQDIEEASMKIGKVECNLLILDLYSSFKKQERRCYQILKKKREI